MSDIVFREVVEKTILTFSKPFARFGMVPIGGRTTAVRLSDESVWVLASTPLTQQTRDKIDSLGKVQYINIGDIEHTGFIKDYHEVYPKAKIFGPEGVSEKLGLKILEWTASGNDPMINENTTLKSEIKAEYFKGFINRDIAFLHVPSKTLIQADLVFNLPGYEQYSKSKLSPKNWLNCFFTLEPDNWVHKKLLYQWGAQDKVSMARSASVVDQWDFNRIIPCHGDVIENEGKSAWRRAFSLYFKDIEDGKLPRAQDWNQEKVH